MTSVRYPRNTSWITSYHKLSIYLRYITAIDDRESWPSHEEPEIDTHLYFITATLLHLVILALCTEHCRHVHSHWSGVLKLLKFDRTQKKGRRKKVLIVVVGRLAWCCGKCWRMKSRTKTSTRRLSSGALAATVFICQCRPPDLMDLSCSWDSAGMLARHLQAISNPYSQAPCLRLSAVCPQDRALDSSCAHDSSR